MASLVDNSDDGPSDDSCSEIPNTFSSSPGRRRSTPPGTNPGRGTSSSSDDSILNTFSSSPGGIYPPGWGRTITPSPDASSSHNRGASSLSDVIPSSSDDMDGMVYMRGTNFTTSDVEGDIRNFRKNREDTDGYYQELIQHTVDVEGFRSSMQLSLRPFVCNK